MSQPSYNPYYDQQQQHPPPTGFNGPPLQGYQGGPAPSMPPPAYGGSGYPPSEQPPYASQLPPAFPPPVHHTVGGYGGPQPNMMAPMQDQDFEANLIKPTTLQFDNKSVRAGFIRKVFGLLTVMLLIVFGMVTLFCLQEDCRLFVRRNPGLYWASYAVFLVTYICIICCESVRRKFPGNFICLIALTLSMGYMTAMISAYYRSQNQGMDSIFLAMGICAACSFCIILFSCQTKYDFTSCMGVMFVISMVLLLFGIFAIIYTVIFRNPILYVVYASLGALVFMVYLAIDTQMVMGGKRYEYSPEDYIVAAVQLFLDIIYIFIYLLQIIGYANRS